MSRCFTRLFLFCAIFVVAPRSVPAANLAVTMDWSPVGNPGNVADPSTGFGAVTYSYNIGTYDVTDAQYAAFLNSVDPTGADPLALYESFQGQLSQFGGISFTAGNANGSKYGVLSGRGSYPVNFVTWYSAIRFANWMDNGQTVYTTEPTAANNATEKGAYTLDGFEPTPSNFSSITRAMGATVFLPNENEWYKAAYYNTANHSYFLYATGSNTAPTPTSPTSAPNSANYSPGGANSPTQVGAYTGTTSPYGAFDMVGNLDEWVQSLSDFGENAGLRGGSFFDRIDTLSSAQNTFDSADGGGDIDGFRLASLPVPEPSTGLLAALASMGFVGLGWRRRRKASLSRLTLANSSHSAGQRVAQSSRNRHQESITSQQIATVVRQIRTAVSRTRCPQK